MNKPGILVASLCVASLLVAVLAQGPAASPPAAAEATTKPAAPTLKPVLQAIPAGSMGYVVINNLQTAVGNVEKYLTDIGLGEMIAEEMPGGMLKTITSQMKIEKGFQPNGGLAVTMLDPGAFDIDLMKMLGIGKDGATTTPATATAPADQPKLPVVAFLPGKGVAEFFANHKTAPAGKFTQVTIEDGPGPLLAVQHGDYILLSPSGKAIEFVIGAKKSAADELNATQAKLLTDSDIAARVNMKVTGPILNKMIKGVELLTDAKEEGFVGDSAPRLPEPLDEIAPALKHMMPFYRWLIGQMEGVTITGRVGKTGLVFDVLTEWAPESLYAKALAEYKKTAATKLARLPNNSYIFALGVANQGGPATKIILTKYMDAMLGEKHLAKLPELTKAKIKDLALALQDQIGGMELVAGGAGEGAEGVFGASCVIECKDAEAFRNLLAQAAGTTQTVIHKLFGEDNEDILQLKITYAKGAETVGETKLDTISITHPDIDEMDEDELSEMSVFLGEEKIRLFVAQADKNTVVVTFGGSKAFMGEALKAAKAGGGTILKGEGVAEAMKYIPKEPTGLMLFNVQGLIAMITKAAERMSTGEAPPFEITTKVPIALGSAVAGSSEHATVYVPTKLVKEIVAAVQGLFAGMMGPPVPMEQPVPEGEDF